MMRRLRTLASKKAAAAIAVVAVMVAIPSVAMAVHFTDTAGNTHADNINWMETTGVTSGCTATKYCPDDPVTRAQMATFMRRLAGQAPGVDPVVNADKINGLEPNQLDVDKVDGMDASAFLGATDQAVDSALLQGFAANSLVRAEHASTTDVPEADGEALSLTIEAPTAGVILVNGWIEVFDSSAGTNVTCSVGLGGIETPSGVDVDWSAGTDGGDQRFGACQVATGIDVAAGSHDISILISGDTVSNTFVDASLTALFVPFQGDGTQPVIP